MALAWGAAVLGSAQAWAVTPMVMIPPDLTPVQVQVQSLTSESLTYFDSQRRMQSVPLRSLVELRCAPAAALAKAAEPAEDAVLVTLVDGQRLQGAWKASQGQDQVLVVQHAELGELLLPLERISAIALGKATVPAGAVPSKDTVKLASGEALAGFVTGMSPEGVRLQLEGQKEDTTLPRARVRSIALANPRQQRPQGSVMLTLADGSRVLGRTLTAAGAGASLDLLLTTKPVQLPLARVHRVELASQAGSLQSLTELEMQVISGGEVFGLPKPPRVEQGQLLLHAPVQVSWKLPAGARRLAFHAALDLEGSPADAWADVVLIVRMDQQELARERLHAARPEAALNLPVSGQQLTLELDPGVNGPVMDRVKLTDAVILLP